MSALQTLLEDIRVELPEVPYPFACRTVNRVARDLCEKTFCWKSGVTTADMVSGTADITISVPATADVIGVQYLMFDHLELVQTSERELSQMDSDWRSTQGDPTHFYVSTQDGVMRLYPKPNRSVTGAFQYECFIRPKTDPIDIEEFLAEQFNETLRNGAFYELMRMPKRSWSNPEQAMYYRTRYRQGVYEARDKAMRGYATESLNITPLTLA